ncbi:MAG TPA: tRNA (adenosine(37)-N6)-threonylcarbamoyltransferase complex transferase subunit TsaD [Flavobacteriales bacterium]|nr:tRNA (adenosine(37)-N6)-threonylcarbamoyltransferase complex transferase subunit TsaD [Flavobacteriales bacterium]
MSQNKDIIILGIESSCDDTSAAVIKNGKIRSNVVTSQLIHEQYGGVVPELASRAHQQNIIPVVHSALQDAQIRPEELTAIGFTRGPGLLGSLLVGVSFAKGLAMSLDIPLVEVNHMIAHVLAHFIERPGEQKKSPKFPFICLTVSGGHTQLVLVRDHLDMEVIGETIDDAAGEAFDKSAKVLGLPYPGGPMIDKYAKTGDPDRFEFSHPSVQGYNYSFSGLKTQFLYFIQKETSKDPEFVSKNLPDICASWQNHIIKVLLSKLKKAVKDYKINQVAIAGGVSANSGLRHALHQMSEEKGWSVFIPDFEYCTDNAAMISMAAHYKFLANEFASIDCVPRARMPI